MKNNEQLMMFFPTTVLIIDDNESFLDSLQSSLGGLFKVKTCTNLDDAYKLLSNETFDNIHSNILESVKLDSFVTDGNLFELKIGELLRYKAEKNRTMTISTVVIDYLFSDKNSLSFCESIKHINVRKVFLTANATDDVGLMAFNDGLIDKFLQKKSTNLIPELTKIIHDEQRKFFKKLNDSLLGGVKNKNNLAMFSDCFFNIFDAVLKENNIVEYYLLDLNGSYLLVNGDGKTKIFTCFSDSDFENYFNIASDLNASENVLLFLKRREKLVFFYSDDDYAVSAEQWENYMHDAKKIKEGLYYAIIENVDAKYPALSC